MSSLENPVRVRAYRPYVGRAPGPHWAASETIHPGFGEPAMLVPLAEWRRLKRIKQLTRDAVEAGAIDECYLSLLRAALKTPKKKGPKHG